ncbi:hypothetical protein EcE24377A_4726 [Escherichia coli O139:H28 str. E24377A]|uniref:Uncharacterized protein n=1 Tax=Escherichia coli O139:H28 (strain E24377A / ETEC) TaxID=331111 RepID=A7ZV38_ECO24|nr:hypothetical protein EcE24377A_4726 [Escherichia coli O139:H28 str. E24377A]
MFWSAFMYFANALQLTDHTGRYIIPYPLGMTEL